MSGAQSGSPLQKKASGPLNVNVNAEKAWKKSKYALLEVLDKTDLRDPLKFTAEMAFLVVASYLGGASGVSFPYVIVFVLVMYEIYKKKHNRVLKRVRHAEALTAWTDIDEEKSKFLKHIMKKLWSHYEGMLSEWVGSKLQPLIDSTRPAFLDSAKIVQITFGDQEPLIRSVKTHETADDDHIVFDLDCSFVGQANMVVDIQYRGGKLVGGNLSKIPVLVGLEEFSTKLRLEFHLMDRSPWISTMDLAFVGNPVVDMALKPLKAMDIMEFPGISRWLNELVSKSLCGYMVLPKTVNIVIGGDSAETTEEPEDEKQVLCVGVFQITFFEAKNLPRSDLTFGMPDPYVKCVFANRTYRTKVVKKSRDPVWNETHEFFVKPSNVPKLKVKIYDRSKLLMDTFLGGARLDMAPLLGSTRTSTWDTVVNMGGKATLHIRCVYRPMAETPNLGSPLNFDFASEFVGATEVPLPLSNAASPVGSPAGSGYNSPMQMDSDDDETPLFTPRKSVRNLAALTTPITAANFSQSLLKARASQGSTKKSSRLSSGFGLGGEPSASFLEFATPNVENEYSSDEEVYTRAGRPVGGCTTPTNRSSKHSMLSFASKSRRRRSLSMGDGTSVLPPGGTRGASASVCETPKKEKKTPTPGPSRRVSIAKEPPKTDKTFTNRQSLRVGVSADDSKAANRQSTRIDNPINMLQKGGSSSCILLPSNPIDVIKNPISAVRRMSRSSVAPPPSTSAGVAAMAAAAAAGMDATSKGVLTVRVIEAINIAKSSTYYVNMGLGAQKLSSGVCKKGKGVVKWQEPTSTSEFFIRDPATDRLVLNLMEQNKVKLDERLGTQDMDVWWAVDGLPHDMWIEMDNNVRLHIEVKYRSYSNESKAAKSTTIKEED